MRLLALLALLAVPARTLAQGVDDDFEVDPAGHSLALGPTPRGGLVAGVGVGWLRSEAYASLGLGYWLDVVLRADSMLLYRGFNAQNSIAGGLRVSPLDGVARFSVTLLAGETYVPLSGATETFTSLRGELTGGAAFERFSVYGRLTLTGVSGASPIERRWTRETEAGIGAETRVLRRLLLGGELFGWGREKSDTLFQWRLRVAWII